MWRILLLAALASSLSAAVPARPGTPEGQALQPADSARVAADAREAQARFERVRVYHAPWGWSASGGPCDERIGRFCLRYSSEREDDLTPPYRPPPEAEAVRVARAVLDSILTEAARTYPGDAWVAGQRTWYRGEVGDWTGALAAARACRSPEPGWCHVLEGYALHGAGRVAEAEQSFDRGLAALPAAERAEWFDLEPLVELEVGQALRRLRGEERAFLEARIWALGNPLFLAGGNALRTEHFARHTAARIRTHARNPHGIRWGGDMTEILVRFGPEVAYERSREPSFVMGPAPVTGRYSWDAKGVFPTMEGILTATEAAPEHFPAAVYRARSRHATPLVPRIRRLQARTARFLRGDSLLVVAAWQVPDPPPWDTVPELAVDRVALFLVEGGVAPPWRFDVGDALVPEDARGHDRGVGVARVPAGDWWLSLEAVDSVGGRGWRHREGVRRPALAPGQVEMSDLLLLAPMGSGREPPAAGGGDAPGSGEDRLEDHLARALAADTLEAGPVEVAWEVYGDPPDPDRLRFVVGVEREERGWFRRAGEALRVLSPLQPVEIGWEERVRGPDDPEAEALPPVYFRRVELDLGGLGPGAWTLRVRLPLPDGTEVTADARLILR
jgi:hypothetical protein